MGSSQFIHTFIDHPYNGMNGPQISVRTFRVDSIHAAEMPIARYATETKSNAPHHH